MSRRRYFEEQRSGNEAIYHCVEIDTDHDTYFEVLDLMSKDESDTVSPDKVNNILNQLRQGSCFNIHTQSISGTGGSTNGSGKGGGGYGGGGGGVRYSMVYAGAGGDGTVLIRGRRYKS